MLHARLCDFSFHTSIGTLLMLMNENLCLVPLLILSMRHSVSNIKVLQERKAADAS